MCSLTHFRVTKSASRRLATVELRPDRSAAGSTLLGWLRGPLSKDDSSTSQLQLVFGLGALADTRTQEPDSTECGTHHSLATLRRVAAARDRADQIERSAGGCVSDLTIGGASLRMTMTLTKREAFEAMRCFLAQFNEREPPERRRTIEQILSWTEIEADGGTSDPAQWHDWEKAVALAISRLGPSSEG